MTRLYALMLVLLTLAGCARASVVSAGGTAARNDRLIIGQSREFNSLLPFANNGYTASELIGLAFSLLVTLDARGAIGDAARAVPSISNGGISRDGRTVTYHLRHDVRWQDGRPLTARDVLFTQRFVMDPHSPMPFRDGFDRVATMRAPDPYTVVVRLRHPYRLFVTDFLGPESPTPILPEHLLANEADILKSAYAAAPIGSGPYRITQWRRGDSVRFAANADWYAGRPAIARIDVRFIPDAPTRLTQLRTHEIDAATGVGFETAAQLHGAPGLRTDVESGPIFTQLTFNLSEPIVAQLAVRRAVAQAIDARSIARTISHGLINGRDAARGLFLWSYDRRAGFTTYDRAAASAGLAAAGWRRGADGIRRDPAGRLLAFTIALRADRSDDAAAAVQIQQQLHAVGIDVALKTYSAPAFTANDGVLRSGRFTAELTQYYPNIDPDPTIFFGCADRGMNGFNDSGYCDPVTDALMAQSLLTSDRRSVLRSLSQVQRRLAAALPMIFVWQGVDVNIVPRRLRNFSDIEGMPFFNAGRWSLEPVASREGSAP